MDIQLDHLILQVNEREASVAFYTTILGFTYEGEQGPFAVIRVNPSLTLQLAPWGTNGGNHLAFAMTQLQFSEIFTRVRDAGIQYGDSFHNVGTMTGPGDEVGARGPGKAVYFFDPNKHLIETRYYETAVSTQ